MNITFLLYHYIYVQRLPYFRLIVSLGAVADLHFEVDVFQPSLSALHGVSSVHTGDWILSESILTVQTLEVSLGDELIPFLTGEVSLVLSMAIEFGKVGFGGQPHEVKYAGSGKC